MDGNKVVLVDGIYRRPFGPESNQHGRVVDPGVFNKTAIKVGLTGYKMVISNSPRCASFTSWLSITSYPARPRRITDLIG